MTLERLVRAGGEGEGKAVRERPGHVTLWDTDSSNHFVLQYIQEHAKHSKKNN